MGNIAAPGGVTSSNRPHSHGTRLPTRSRGLGRGLPPRVRRPPRRPHSSATRRRHHHETRTSMPRSVLLGEDTVSCMPRSFAPVVSSDLSQRTHHAYTVCSLLSSPLRGLSLSNGPTSSFTNRIFNDKIGFYIQKVFIVWPNAAGYGRMWSDGEERLLRRRA